MLFMTLATVPAAGMRMPHCGGNAGSQFCTRVNSCGERLSGEPCKTQQSAIDLPSVPGTFGIKHLAPKDSC